VNHVSVRFTKQFTCVYMHYSVILYGININTQYRDITRLEW